MGQITLKQVTKSFGDVEVIKPLDLEIDNGEFVVFVGPSGCGKSLPHIMLSSPISSRISMSARRTQDAPIPTLR